MEIREIDYRASEVAFNEDRGASHVARCEPTPGVLCPTHREMIASSPWEDLVELWEFARDQDDGLALVQCAFPTSEGRCGEFMLFCSRSSAVETPADAPLMPMFVDFGTSPGGAVFGPVANHVWWIKESKGGE
tara:strand:+ start:128 stop:526 length:399 start_codon:yes stop_codon:yes gene_type:complete